MLYDVTFVNYIDQQITYFLAFHPIKIHDITLINYIHQN